ncbi:MAG: GNAT family N-acetyltransferase [Erysipelotrichaceae bacterium]|nr:GNAT family N-acetyltransferase [Erysipelotrichaceae bacterium]
MNQVSFINKPVLIGNRIILRPFENNDIQDMIEILNEPEVKKLTGSVTNDNDAIKIMDEDEKIRVSEWYKTRNVQSDRLDLAITLKDSNQIIGEVVFNEYDELTNNVNFRVLISQSYSNQGLGSEAIQLFIQYGFEQLNLHKISLEVFSFNPRAEHVYTKVGFKLEGIKREDFKYNEMYIDTKVFGFLKSEYDQINDRSQNV